MTILSGMVQVIPHNLQLQALASDPRLLSKAGSVCEVMCACINVFLQGKNVSHNTMTFKTFFIHKNKSLFQNICLKDLNSYRSLSEN